MQLPLQNFRKNVHKSLIHMEAASPKMRNRHFGVELGAACFELHTLKFLSEGANALIVGKPGTGKVLNHEQN